MSRRPTDEELRERVLDELEPAREEPLDDAPAVQRHVKEALMRTPGLDAHSIWITMEGSTCRLHGRVRSRSERRLAKRAASSVRGVTKVADDLIVVP